MARLPRLIIPGQPQHVILRGNNRGEIFCGRVDYLFFLEALWQCCTKHGLALHAYVLMTNHVHLLATPRESSSLAKTIQSVGRRYVQYFNCKYQRTGTLWEGRYRATLVDSTNYFLICMRYIELNPVRAGLVAHPSLYPWSSYAANAHGRPDKLLTPHEEYLRLGCSEWERQRAYCGLMGERTEDATLEIIRDSINCARVLGGAEYKSRVRRWVERKGKVGGDGGRVE